MGIADRSNRHLLSGVAPLVLAILCLFLAAAATWAEGFSDPPEVRPLARSVPAAVHKAVVANKAVAVSEAADVVGVTQGGGASCVQMIMACNQTVNGSLTVDDCALDDGTYADFWTFSGATGQTVTVDGISSAFDAYLFLLDPTPEVVAADDDSGSGSNARIVHDLDQTGEWTIVMNNLLPTAGDPGSYTVSLDCSGATPGAPVPPSNLTTDTVSASAVDLFWQDNSNNEDEFRVELRPSGGSFQDIGSVPADNPGARISNLDPASTYDFRVRARSAAGDSAYSNTATTTTFPDGCAPGATNLCLNNDRFRVHVDFRTAQGATGEGQVVPVSSDDSGLMWFFSDNNWEMLIKVLNGCSINNQYWVFFAATTDVEFTLTVTDTQEKLTEQYFNPLGQAADAITDTSAFATCP